MRRLLLAAVVAWLVANPQPGEAQQPPAPKILKRWAGGASSPLDLGARFEPSYIPIRLLLTPYDSWTKVQKDLVPQSVYDNFWEYMRSFEERGQVPKCLPPVISDTYEGGSWSSIPSGSLNPAKMAGAFPAAVLATQIYQEAVWAVDDRRVATLRHLRIDEVAKNESALALAQNDIVTVVAQYGSVKINGRIFCSLAANRALSNPVDGQVVVESKQFLILGHLPLYQDKHLQADEAHMFRLVGSLLYPPPGIPAYDSQPMSWANFLAGLKK